ncbi:MAG TPA: glycosyltransferase family 2 protein [bacterium]|nr:glycosyltransferase family 2 protein [bacterium]
MRKGTLSVPIITLNEEKNIARCLDSLKALKPFFDKVQAVVVDAGSRDKTLALARARGAQVHTRAWKGFGDQKNWALSRCRGDWILSLDADEELTPALCAEIGGLLKAPPPGVDGYFIKRRAFFLGKWIRHCGWWPDSQLRLIRKGKGRFTDEPVHEGLEVAGETPELKEPMNHYTYDSIRQYLDKMNHYSGLAVLDVKKKKKLFWAYYLTLAPFFTFTRMYLSRRGFLDGWHGFVVCGLSAFHDFAKYAKLWEKEVLRRHA